MAHPLHPRPKILQGSSHRPLLPKLRSPYIDVRPAIPLCKLRNRRCGVLLAAGSDEAVLAEPDIEVLVNVDKFMDPRYQPVCSGVNEAVVGDHSRSGCSCG